MRLSYRAEIRPTPRQRAALLQHAGNARWAYNWGLRQHREAYEQWVELDKPEKWGGSRKRGLNRVVLDAAFGEFRRLLEYKGKLYGCEVVAVPPHFTSQRCSACGHVEKGNRVSQSEFRCLSCGHEANADLNAAINILALGRERATSSSDLTKNACGEDVRSPEPLGARRQTSMKQEPGISRPRVGESDRGISLATVRSLVPA